MFNERPVLSSLLIALILFLPDPLAMLNVENERKDLTSMVDEPEAGAMDGPEKIAASAECDVDVGINVERLDRAARLRGMIDNSISMRSAMSTKGQRGGRYYYLMKLNEFNDAQLVRHLKGMLALWIICIGLSLAALCGLIWLLFAGASYFFGN